MNKCIFLDRDGVINRDRVDYVYGEERLEILPGVVDAITSLKRSGYRIIIITNQSGISKGLYTRTDMHVTHDLIQKACKNQIDDIYYAPGHPSTSETLSRKPDSLMFERAIAKHNIDIRLSWMIGDKERDLIPAKKLGVKTIQVDYDDSKMADYHARDLADAVEVIFS